MTRAIAERLVVLALCLIGLTAITLAAFDNRFLIFAASAAGGWFISSVLTWRWVKTGVA